MWRHVWPTLLATAWVVCSGVAFADDSSNLNLPAALSTETLSKASAKGAPASANASADAEVDGQSLHASAAAEATIENPIAVTGPFTTGNIDGLTATGSQVSTGFGNIQQGVSATAISF
jgi:hypothetical protein